MVLVDSGIDVFKGGIHGILGKFSHDTGHQSAGVADTTVEVVVDVDDVVVVVVVVVVVRDSTVIQKTKAVSSPDTQLAEFEMYFAVASFTPVRVKHFSSISSMVLSRLMYEPVATGLCGVGWSAS